MGDSCLRELEGQEQMLYRMLSCLLRDLITRFLTKICVSLSCVMSLFLFAFYFFENISELYNCLGNTVLL